MLAPLSKGAVEIHRDEQCRLTRPLTTPLADEHIRVWDVPTRLFHWGMVALVFVSWLSADQGYMAVHLWSGLSLLALLLFRLGWGLMGSTTARFSDFLRPPREVLAYLRSQARGATILHAGHNPAGGLMVIALLAFTGWARSYRPVRQ